MRIKFQNIKIENFLSIGEMQLDLSNKGYTLVKGENFNQKDNSSSNGSGKSSLWEAITWVLTGDTIRGTSDVVNINTQGDCVVELSLKIDDKDFLIIRRKKRDSSCSLQFYIDGEPKTGKGIRDTEKLLNQYLPELTSELLGSVIILGQGLPQRFTNNTPAGRKEILEKLSKSDFMIEDIKNKLSERSSYLSNTQRKYENEILELNVKTESLEERLKKLENEKEKLIPEDFESLINQTNSLIEINKQELEDLIKVDNKYNEDVNLLRESIYKKQMEGEIEKQKINSSFQERLNPIEDFKREISSKIYAAQKEIENIHSMKEYCPTCGQKLPDIHKPDTTELEKNLSNLNVEMVDIKNKEDILREENSNLIKELNDKILKQTNETKNKLKNLIDSQGNELKKSIPEKQNKIKSLEIELNNIKNRKEFFFERISTIDSEISSIKSNISKLKEENLYKNSDKEKIDRKLFYVNKMLKIATREFRGYLLTNIINFIGKISKDYCQQVFKTDLLDFKLEKGNVLISYDNKPYENLSGGEKQKVDIIIQFAIREMLCLFSNFSSNIIVLDELFDNIDSTGAEMVIDLISKVLQDIDSVFIITHHSDIPLPTDSVINIVKDSQGISYLK